MSDQDFFVEVLDRLSELNACQAETRAEVRAIVQRLDKLNGTVAQHQREIGQIRLAQAEEKGAEETSAKWWETIKPIAWLAAGMLGVLVLQHAEAMLAFLRS